MLQFYYKTPTLHSLICRLWHKSAALRYWKREPSDQKPCFLSLISQMASFGYQRLLSVTAILLAVFATGSNCIDIFLEWNVAFDDSIQPASKDQSVITINGMFPGPLINTTTNDIVHVNVFNNLDEPLLFTWNGIQQRLNSWQDGVSGTNCPIKPGTNWTYEFQTKDQIGTFMYFPSTNFHKSAGGYGPLRVNNRAVISVPFAKPGAEYDLLIGDWYFSSIKITRSRLSDMAMAYSGVPDMILMNGKGPFGDPLSKAYESFNVAKGNTYMFRISNVGSTLSFNFRIQNHKLVLVETEGSYTSQITLDSLDIHVGQSYSVLVTADQTEADYYMVATPKLLNVTDDSSLAGKGILRYSGSNSPATGPLPAGPDPFDVGFSIDQAKSIRWNLTTGAARPNPQGTFNVSKVVPNQTFVLQASTAVVDTTPQYVVNNVSYLTVETPLKLADFFVNGSGVYRLDAFPVSSVNDNASYGVSVVSGLHKGWIELVFQSNLVVMDSWHLDGFGFFVVGFGSGQWTLDSRNTYNIYDPVVRSTVQLYPGGWTAVYAFLDNPGMWNLRSQSLKNWYLGEEIYIKVQNNDPNPAKERPPPKNLLLCGMFSNSDAPVPSPAGW